MSFIESGGNPKAPADDLSLEHSPADDNSPHQSDFVQSDLKGSSFNNEQVSQEQNEILLGSENSNQDLAGQLGVVTPPPTPYSDLSFHEYNLEKGPTLNGEMKDLGEGWPILQGVSSDFQAAPVAAPANPKVSAMALKGPMVEPQNMGVLEGNVLHTGVSADQDIDAFGHRANTEALLSYFSVAPKMNKNKKERALPAQAAGKNYSKEKIQEANRLYHMVRNDVMPLYLKQHAWGDKNELRLLCAKALAEYAEDRPVEVAKLFDLKVRGKEIGNGKTRKNIRYFLLCEILRHRPVWQVLALRDRFIEEVELAENGSKKKLNELNSKLEYYNKRNFDEFHVDNRDEFMYLHFGFNAHQDPISWCRKKIEDPDKPNWGVAQIHGVKQAKGNLEFYKHLADSARAQHNQHAARLESYGMTPTESGFVLMHLAEFLDGKGPDPKVGMDDVMVAKQFQENLTRLLLLKGYEHHSRISGMPYVPSDSGEGVQDERRDLIRAIIYAVSIAKPLDLMNGELGQNFPALCRMSSNDLHSVLEKIMWSF